MLSTTYLGKGVILFEFSGFVGVLDGVNEVDFYSQMDSAGNGFSPIASIFTYGVDAGEVSEGSFKVARLVGQQPVISAGTQFYGAVSSGNLNLSPLDNPSIWPDTSVEPAGGSAVDLTPILTAIENIPAAVESALLNEADGRAIQAAMVAKIQALDTTVSNLSAQAIAALVVGDAAFTALKASADAAARPANVTSAIAPVIAAVATIPTSTSSRAIVREELDKTNFGLRLVAL